MKAVDTNILVRWITRDDAGQAALADRVMAQPVFVPPTVLVELAWVLAGKTYRLNRAALTAVLGAVLDTRTISIPAEDDVRWAIARFAAGGDIADMLHIATSRGAEAFVSFENDLAEHAGLDAPIPVERP